MKKYFALVGSYEGGIKIGHTWYRATDLNHVNKQGWQRHQGPLTPAQARCLRQAFYFDGSSASVGANLVQCRIFTPDLLQYVNALCMRNCTKSLAIGQVYEGSSKPKAMHAPSTQRRVVAVDFKNSLVEWEPVAPILKYDQGYRVMKISSFMYWADRRIS